MTMELDDLKTTWNASQDASNSNKNIMELIQHKKRGPVTALKTQFRNQILIMVVLPVTLLFVNINNIHNPASTIFYICYVVFCVMVILNSFLNYQAVRKMENMDGSVKNNLEQQITILEKRLQWNLVALPVVLLFFILLTEIMPFIGHNRIVDRWHTVHPLFRIGTYVILFTAQYFLSRKVTARKYGQHLLHLKELVKQM